MAQSLTDKRQNLCVNLVNDLKTFWDTLNRLRELSLERTVVGDFDQAEFDEKEDLRHLNPTLVGLLLETHIPAIAAFVDDAGTPARRQNILEALR